MAVDDTPDDSEEDAPEDDVPDEDDVLDEAALEAELDYLVDEGVLDENDDGLAFSDGMADAWLVYADSYADEDEATIVSSFAELFDLPREDAAEHVEAAGVTREDLVAYLALRSELDDPPGRERLAVLATLVEQVGPPAVVPPALDRLADDEVDPFVAEHGDVVVTVWKQQCEPCRALKAHLDTLLDAFPDHVSVVGVDGDEVPSFRRTTGVDAAPAVVLFADGEHAHTITGAIRMDELQDALDDAY